jgi:ABC-type lipoprotein release transport system permease subunit
MVSVCGVTLATMALVCVLSVFNGFQDLIATMFGALDPQLKITAVKGKTFDTNKSEIRALQLMPEILATSEVIEENALLKYRSSQVTATLKGVSTNFNKVCLIDSVLFDGEFIASDSIVNYGTIGAGLSQALGIGARFVDPLEVFAPKRNKKVNLTNPSSAFNTDYIYVSAVFNTNQPQFDESMIIVPIALTRSLFDYTTEVTALELKLKPDADISGTQKKIKKLLGNNYRVADRFEQQEESFKMMQIEKWMTFLILCFVLMIATFNIIGSLSMLIIEKEKDIQTLRNLGADKQLISRIFLLEGWMISAMGAIIGLALGLILCFLQQEYGLLRLSNGSDVGMFVVDAYPVKIVWSDVILILSAVLALAFFTAWYPVKAAKRKWTV